MFSTTRVTSPWVDDVATCAQPPAVLWTIALCSRFVASWPQQRRVPAVARQVRCDVAALGKRQKLLGRRLGSQRQIDGFTFVDAPLGRSESEQRLCHGDGAVIGRGEALEGDALIRVGVVTCDVEHRSHHRQGRAQLM